MNFVIDKITPDTSDDTFTEMVWCENCKIEIDVESLDADDSELVEETEIGAFVFVAVNCPKCNSVLCWR